MGDPTGLQTLGMKLAVPFNHDPGLLEALAPYRQDIAEIFLPAPPDVFGTFRPWTGPDPLEYRRRLPSIAREARDMGLAVDMVMNVPYMPFHEHPGIVAYVAEAMDQGIGWFTLSDLHVAEAVRDACPGAGIVASTVAEVSSVTRARYWVRQAGVNRIVLPRLLNKRPDDIRAMGRVGVSLEVIVNESCIPGCPYAVAHCMALGGRGTADESEAGRFQDLCRVVRADHPWEHFKSEILPFSVHHLEGLVTHLKLAGRDAPTGHIVAEVERFTSLTSNRNSQLGCYTETEDVWDLVSTCDLFCEDCGLCEAAFDKANPDFARTALKWLTGNRPPAVEDTGSRTAAPPGTGLSDALFPLEELETVILGPAGLAKDARVGEFTISHVEHEGNAIRLEVGDGATQATFFAAPRDDGDPAFIRTDRWNLGYRSDGDLDDGAAKALEEMARRLESATPADLPAGELRSWFPTRKPV